ncbi:hypothetical protein ABNX41_07295 [Rhodobacteraceae bacterium PA1-206B]
MLILLIALTIFTEVLVAGVVLAFDGGWLLALVLAQGAGCAAVLGAGSIGNGPQHIHETEGAECAALSNKA